MTKLAKYLQDTALGFGYERIGEKLSQDHRALLGNHVHLYKTIRLKNMSDSNPFALLSNQVTRKLSSLLRLKGNIDSR